LVKFEELLEAGEVLIKESGKAPYNQVTYVVSSFTHPQGRLFLTNKRLIFVPGNFQYEDSTILVLKRLLKSPETVQVYLNSITKVEKGWGEHINVYADKKYDFRGMKRAGEWITAIEETRASAYSYSSPSPVELRPAKPVGGSFCPNCGQPVGLADRYCQNCGAKQG